MNNDEIYYKKYLKYKNKYFNLLKELQNGGTAPQCSFLIKNKNFPTLVIKDNKNFTYLDAKYDPKTNRYLGKWCQNPNGGFWNLDPKTIVSKQTINSKLELLKLCGCNK
jgi:hypothetical protein